MTGILKKVLLIFIFINQCISGGSSPRLLIKMPTRGRANHFFSLLDKYYVKLSKAVPYHFLISCDIDDASMNTPEVINRFSNYTNLTVIFGNNTSKIAAYNCDIEKFDFDILLVTSDDMEPLVNNYDQIIVGKMLEHFPDFDGVLNFNDGFVNSQCNTLPIVGKKYFDRFKYVYHPAYKSLWCDVEFTQVSRLLGKEAIFDDVIIKHNHPSNVGGPIDEIYQKNNALFNVDYEVFKKRKQNYFGCTEEEMKCTKLWSILLCNKKNTEGLIHLENIQIALEKQIAELGLQNNIEVLIDTNMAPLGFKRNSLIGYSKGLYVCFIDSEMTIATDYVKTIYSALLSKPDCVEIVGLSQAKNKLFVLSISRVSNSGVDCLPISHINPMKRIIALMMPFFDHYHTDEQWSKYMVESGLLKIEKEVNKPIIFT